VDCVARYDGESGHCHHACAVSFFIRPAPLLTVSGPPPEDIYKYFIETCDRGARRSGPEANATAFRQWRSWLRGPDSSRIDNCSLASPLGYAPWSGSQGVLIWWPANESLGAWRSALGSDRAVELCCNCCFGAHQCGRSGMLSLRIR
jgi:hypothetical protein